jgi:hypothetical protein
VAFQFALLEKVDRHPSDRKLFSHPFIRSFHRPAVHQLISLEDDVFICEFDIRRCVADFEDPFFVCLMVESLVLVGVVRVAVYDIFGSDNLIHHVQVPLVPHFKNLCGKHL